MTMQALLNNGDEVLIPAPDYPLWTAAVSLAGGKPVHYLCDEDNGWQPDLEDIEAKVTDRTKAIVVINPNNPTGSVYEPARPGTPSRGGRARRGCCVLADEIYDKILYDGAVHTSTASRCPDVLCLTFNGLSKSYRVAGFRSGWVGDLSDPRCVPGSWRASSCWRRRGCARTCPASTPCRWPCRDARASRT